MKRIFRVSLGLSIIATVLTPISAQAISSNPSTVCVGKTCTVDFTYTGDYYKWTVPASTSFTFESWGAAGGGTGSAYYGTGGRGGYAKGSTSLTAGTFLYVYVGQEGLFSDSIRAFNGGGSGDKEGSNGPGYGGGGASHIATSVGALSTLSANRSSIQIVAGAGGGAGGSTNSAWSAYATNGGFGGGLSGGVGTDALSSGRPGGTGGTQLAAGTPSGSFGLGGSGPSFMGNNISGGGGGGGFYGGGAGDDGGGGGGGGSSYLGTLSNTSIISGNSLMPNPASGTMTGRSGNGFVRISYTWGTASILLGLSGGASRVTKGQSIVITATIDFAGKVTFFADRKRIPGCISLQASIGAQTCNWRPSVQKSVALTARIDPSGAASATSLPLNISVTKRTSLR
jgi:hypothetical protein